MAKKIMDSLKTSLTGKEDAPKKEQKPKTVDGTYVGKPITVTGKIRKPKAKVEKKVVKPVAKKKVEAAPKKERRTIKSSYQGDMDPDKVESQVGKFKEQIIVNDTQETVAPEYNQRLEHAATEMSNAEKDAPNLWTGLAPLATL